MELCGGRTLSKLVSSLKSRKLSEEKAAEYFVPLVEAVEYIHREGICHRDLKLSNILICTDDSVKLIDFGFADNSGAKLRDYCGTPSYMAPELIDHEKYYGRHVDIWALGVVLYRLVTGDFPFGSKLLLIYRRHRYIFEGEDQTRVPTLP